MRDVAIRPPLAAHFAELCMTDATEGDLDEHLAGAQRRHLDLVHDEGLARLDENGSQGSQRHLLQPSSARTDAVEMSAAVSPTLARACSWSPVS